MRAGTRLGGVHLELTGEDVTECIGGARELTERDLERAYRSTVDPRLNYEQSLEIAMAIVRKQGKCGKGFSAGLAALHLLQSTAKAEAAFRGWRGGVGGQDTP